MNDYELESLRRELCLVSSRAYVNRMQSGNGGNISCRVPGRDLMLVTGSGTSFIDCEPESFLLTNLDGDVVAGVGKPTREVFMHGHIYRERSDVNAIVHVHSPYAIAVAHRCDELPKPTWHSRMKIRHPIPVLAVPSPMVRPEDWEQVHRTLAEYPGLGAFVLRDHGTVCMGSSIREAEHLCELVEESAEIALFSAVWDYAVNDSSN